MNLLSPRSGLVRSAVRGLRQYQTARIPGISHGLSTDRVSRDLHALQGDLNSLLEYLSALPENLKKAAAYNFFSSFFTHYLPKKFLRRYIEGSGSPPSMILGQQEMIDCNPYINVMNSRDFMNQLLSANLKDASRPSTRSLKFNCPSSAMTNGTLGQFTTRINATLVFKAMDDWTLTGKMTFYDEWDFDPKDFSTGGRSLQGEIKTRFANFTLPGKGFTIESEAVEFQQSSTNAMIVWRGGRPRMVPDKVAALDMKLKELE